MKKQFESIISCLISGSQAAAPLTGIEITKQFQPDETTPVATFRNLNAAALISLCGESHPSRSRVKKFFNSLRDQPAWRDRVDFYDRCASLIGPEIEERYKLHEDFRRALDELYQWVKNPQNFTNREETIKKVWGVFFPEGVSLLNNKRQNIEVLRTKRAVQISELNQDPISEPASEILFTSNVLLTLPSPNMSIDELALSENLKTRLCEIHRESQRYWYDHPIQIGVDKAKNEVVHGLKGLDQAVAFEKSRGVVKKDAKVHCVLSVSVTHPGLQSLAKAYLEEVLKQAIAIYHLHVYVLTESDVGKLIDEILDPACRYYFGSPCGHILRDTVGVDGEYGRHYSLLKSISAFWQVLLNSDLKGTFKIDLDQVFPQNELIKETGASAFEHLKTPLWGAGGVDQNGDQIRLGMIAGALVNEKDIIHSLFTPDVSFSHENITGEEWVFCSRLPQALSTEAEMMCRYGGDKLNGVDRCIQRIHVTGGTCGILVESLRRHRPFTPSFIGRAEDQAYLLSVLFDETREKLRYVHKDGLIMRHDKDVFAGEAIRSASIGKLINDYARILLFSYYARALPWALKDTKDILDPFTGCFVSHIPFTVVSLRLALKGAVFFNEGRPTEGYQLLKIGTTRLFGILNELAGSSNSLKERYLKEKKAWNIFYDLLDKIEWGLEKGEPFAIDLKEKAHALIKAAEMNLNVPK